MNEYRELCSRGDSVCQGGRAMQQCGCEGSMRLLLNAMVNDKVEAEGDESGEVGPETARVMEDLVYHAQVLAHYFLDREN